MRIPREVEETTAPTMRFGGDGIEDPVISQDKLKKDKELKEDEIYKQAEEVRDKAEAKQLKDSFNLGAKQKPKDISPVVKFARDNRMPVDFVKRNKDLLFNMAKTQGIDFDKINKESPATAKLLSDPNKAAIIQDDVKELTSMEKRLKLMRANDDDGFFSGLWNSAQIGYAQGKASQIYHDGLENGVDKDILADQVAAASQEAQRLRANIPASVLADNLIVARENKRFSNAIARIKKDVTENLGRNLIEAGGEGLDMLASWVMHPRAMMYVNAESTHTMIKPMAMGGAGAALGTTLAIALPMLSVPLGVAGIAGGLLGSYFGAVESEEEASATEQAGAAGFDLSNRDEVRASLDNKKLMSEILTKARRKGQGTAIVDTALTAVGASFLRKAGKATRFSSKVKMAGVGQSFEVASEVASEGTGQFYMHDFDISKVSVDDMIAEGQGSFLSFGGAAQASAYTMIGGATSVSERVKDHRANKDVVNLRKNYSKNPIKALQEIARDHVKTRQAIKDFESVDGLFNDMEGVTNTDEINGIVRDFAEDSNNGKENNVYYNTSDEFDHFAEENGATVQDLVDEMSPETKKAYDKSKADGSIFTMKASDFAAIIATRPELRELGKIISVREGGVSLAEGMMNINRGNALRDILIAEQEEIETGKKVELKAKTKINRAVMAKIEMAGATTDQAKAVSSWINQILDFKSEILEEDIEDFYNKFTLNFAKKDITLKTQSAINKRLKLEERAKLADSLEGISEQTAQKILKHTEINEQVINDVMLADTNLDIKVDAIVESIKQTTPKFGTFKKPMKFKHMNPEQREMAQEQVDMMVEQFAYEVGQAEKASEKYVDVDPNSIDPSTGKVYGRSKDKIITPSTFPADYRLAKVSGKKEVFLAAVNAYKETGKKNKLYERIEKIAAQRLVEGYESKQEGAVAPDNTYRSTVGMAMVDEKGDIVTKKEGFDLFATDNRKGEGVKTGAITVLNRNFMIEVFKNGDINTLLHETGHLWLELTRITVEELMAKESLTYKQTQYIKNAEAMLEHLGVKSFDEIGTDQHEKFAETVHSWVGTGKAPNVELETFFYQFKSWVIGFFKDAKNAGMEITPEIDRFMGGLMASEMEMEIAQDNYDQVDEMQESMILNLKPDDRAAYMETRIRHRLNSTAEMTNYIVNTKDAEIKRERNKHRKVIREEVENEVADDIRYTAVAMLRDTKNNIKLVRDYIEELMGEGFADNMPNGTVTQEIENGVHPDEIAQSLGFTDGIEMMNELAYLQNKSEYIAQETENRLTIKYPDILWDDKQMQEYANEVISSSDTQIKIKQMEINYWLTQDTKESKKLIKKLNQQLKTNEQYKAQAKKEIQEGTLKEARPYTYQLEVTRENKLAGEAFSDKGDIGLMIQHKQNELLALEKQKEAVKVKRYVTKMEKKFKKLNSLKSKEHEVSLIMGAKKILSRFNYGNFDVEKLDKELAILQENDKRKAQIIANHINKLDVDLDQDYKDLSVKDFRAVAETVSALMGQARDEMMLTIEGQKIATETAAEAMGAQFNKHTLEFEGVVKKGIRRAEEAVGQYTYENSDPTRLDLLWDGLMSKWVEMRRMEHWGTAADFGNKVTGPITKYLVKPVLKAVDSHRVYKREIMDELKVVYEKRREAGTETGVIQAPELSGNGKTFTFKNKSELLGYLQHMGNKSNLEKLLLGHKIEGVDPVTGEVSFAKWNNFVKEAIADGRIVEADMDFIQGVWDVTAKMLPDAQKTHMQIEGKYFDKIPHTAIEAFGRTYEGGYVPVVINGYFDSEHSQRISEEAIFNAENFFMFPSTGKGFTHDRKNGTARISTDVDLIASHVDKVSRYIHIQPAVTNAIRMVNHKAFSTAVNRYDKHAIEGLIKPWLNRAASQRVSKATSTSPFSVDRLSTTVRANVGIQRMTGNFVNTIQQLTGFSISATRVGKKQLFSAFLEVSKDNAKHLGHALRIYTKDRHGVREFINGKSDFMKERVGGQMVGMNKELEKLVLNQNIVMKGRDQLRTNAYFMQEFTQNFVDTVTWQAAYDEAKTEGKKDSDAIWIADSAVRETQGSFNAEDISSYEAGSPFFRLFTMFYSYFNMQANLMGTEFHMAIEKHGLKKAMPFMLESYFYGIVMPAFMSELLIKGMSGNFDEDEDGELMDEFGSAFFNSTARGTMALFPLVGKVGTYAIDAVMHPDWRNRDARFSAAGQAIGDTFKTIDMGVKLYNGKKINTNDAVRSASEAIGLILGTPVEPIRKAVRYFSDMDSDDNILDMTRGVLSGKASK